MGILAPMSERRSEKRSDSPERRDILRPPLWLNVLLLLIAAAAFLFAGRQRRLIDAEFTRVFSRSSAAPSELNQITAELAEMDLAGGALDKELESRVAYVGSLKALDYYLSIDTAKKTIALKSGNEIVRQASVQLGAPLAAKGSFAIVGKRYDAAPATGKPGRFVISLPNDRAISSPSIQGPKAGSFMAPEEDLRTIWDKITPETRVYVF